MDIVKPMIGMQLSVAANQGGEKVEDPFVTYKDRVEEADFTLDYVKDKHQEI